MERRDAAAEKFGALLTAAVFNVVKRYTVLTHGVGGVRGISNEFLKFATNVVIQLSSVVFTLSK